MVSLLTWGLVIYAGRLIAYVCQAVLGPAI